MNLFSDLTSMTSSTIPIRIGGDDLRHAFTCNLYLQLIESRSRSFGDELRTLLETSYPSISLYDASLILEEFYLKLCNVPTDLITAIESCEKIGKIRVSDTEIGIGSNGTIVVEGFYDFVPVAVKRILKSHYDVALKEKEHLRVSDNHANIVRLYDVEEDRNFVYIALERCNCSLHDLILGRDQSNPSLNMEVFKDFKLRKPYGGFPSPELLKVMRETVAGLGHLHEHGIIHRDVKPQNVLLLKDSSNSVTAKVSDMGISKRLPADTSFLTKSATGDGTFGWQAPEQLLRKEGQTRVVDMFSFGCLLFFCITGGKHPYGTDMLERCKNIVDDVKRLSLINHIPEAFHLISELLDPKPKLRPTASQVPHHPLLWDPETRLSFLTNASDRIQLETRGSNLLKTLEANGKDVTRGKWATNLHHHGIPISEFKPHEIHDVSVRGLLRFIRNKRSHYVELSENVQNVLGSISEEYESYFTNRFPKLFLKVYRVLQCKYIVGKKEFSVSIISIIRKLSLI